MWGGREDGAWRDGERGGGRERRRGGERGGASTPVSTRAGVLLNQNKGLNVSSFPIIFCISNHMLLVIQSNGFRVIGQADCIRITFKNSGSWTLRQDFIR